MLVEAPFADILREWQWSKPSGTTALFWVLAVVAVGLAAVGRCRRRLTVFELLVLAVTFVGAVQAVRGVIWFAVACAAILPIALDGLLTRADPSSRRVNLAISVASLAGLAVALVVALARPASWFEQEWPEEQVAAVRKATLDPSVDLLATDGTADWLLWRIPESGAVSRTTSASSSTTRRRSTGSRPTGTGRARRGSRSPTATAS